MEEKIRERLQKAKTVAILGCSANKHRTSYHIANYLKENGYRIVPVNPNYDEILGERCYPNINDIPPEIDPDIVSIFRNPEHTAGMVQDIIRFANGTGRKPLVWTQLGVSTDEAKSIAETGGLDYVENRCIMVEHSQLG